MRPSISKITTAKRIGGVAQAVQHLLCKWEALSSNPSPTPPKKIDRLSRQKKINKEAK
jgi:hypothetical protein